MSKVRQFFGDVAAFLFEAFSNAVDLFATFLMFEWFEDIFNDIF